VALRLDILAASRLESIYQQFAAEHEWPQGDFQDAFSTFGQIEQSSLDQPKLDLSASCI
jgi:hypothetical protein